MNTRKPTDYTVLFAALDRLITTALPQMKLYCEIGRLISSRPEKGAAVTAAEYLQTTYPDTTGFSPRNLRRMREFYRAYESSPEMLATAMEIGWTQNVVILEADLTLQERAWYLQAVRQFRWSKLELRRQITANAHISLDLTGDLCYTEESIASREVPSHAAAADHQCQGIGSPGTANGLPAFLCLLHPELLCRGVYPQPLLVRGGPRWPVGVADGGSPEGHGGLRQAVLQEGGAGQPGVVLGLGQLPAQWLRLRRPLR